MSENPKPKFRALIPEVIQDPLSTQDVPVLRKALSDLGFDVKSYRTLGDLNEIEDRLTGCQSDSRVLLFVDVSPHAENAEEVAADPESGKPLVSTEVVRSKYEPFALLNLAEIAADNISELISGQRSNIQTVFMLPHNSELLRALPPRVNFLAKPLYENDTNYLVRKWISQSENGLDRMESQTEPSTSCVSEDPEQKFRDTLTAMADGISFDGEPDSMDPKVFATDPTVLTLSKETILSPSERNRFETFLNSIRSHKEKLLLHPHDPDWVSSAKGSFLSIQHDHSKGNFLPFVSESVDRNALGDLQGVLSSVQMEAQLLGLPTDLIPDPLSPNAIDSCVTLFQHLSAQLADGEILSSPSGNPTSIIHPSDQAQALASLETNPSVDFEELLVQFEQMKSEMQEADRARIEAELRARKSDIGKKEIDQIARQHSRHGARLARIRLETEVEDYHALSDFFNLHRPGTRYRPKSVGLFKDNMPDFSLVVERDYTVNRDIPTLSEMLGFKNIVLLKNSIQDIVQSHLPRTRSRNRSISSEDPLPVTLHLGPGNGSILDAFAAAEGDHPSQHIAYGFSLLASLPELLQRVLQVPSDESGKFPSQDKLAFLMSKFLPLLGNLFADCAGHDGRYQVRLDNPEDHRRLREHLIALASHPMVQSIANQQRKTVRGTDGLYDGNKRVKVTEAGYRMLVPFCNDPQVFLDKFFPGFTRDMTPEELREFFKLRGRDMIYGDFRELPQRLAGAEQFITFAYDSRASSHIDDEDYLKMCYATACHLMPGGAYLVDGFRESYTWYRRIDELRVMREKLNRENKEEFEVYLIGDFKAPKSALIVRKIPTSDHQGYAFPNDEITAQLAEQIQMVRIDKYEKAWPLDSFRNKLYWWIKQQTLLAINEGIEEGRFRTEITNIWKKKYYDRIYEKVERAISALIRIPEEIQHYQAMVRDRNQQLLEARKSPLDSPAKQDERIKTLIASLKEAEMFLINARSDEHHFHKPFVAFLDRIREKKIKPTGNPRFFHQVLRIHKRAKGQESHLSPFDGDFGFFFKFAKQRFNLDMNEHIANVVARHSDKKKSERRSEKKE